MDSQEYKEYIENDAQVKKALSKLYSMYSPEEIINVHIQNIKKNYFYEQISLWINKEINLKQIKCLNNLVQRVAPFLKK